jgi:hypothetical protein
MGRHVGFSGAEPKPGQDFQPPGTVWRLGVLPSQSRGSCPQRVLFVFPGAVRTLLPLPARAIRDRPFSDASRIVK